MHFTKTVIFVASLVAFLQLTACVTPAQKQSHNAPENNAAVQPTENSLLQESTLSTSKVDNLQDFKILENKPVVVSAIQGNIEYLNKGKAGIFDVKGFRKLLRAEEKPDGIVLNFEGADIKEIISLVVGKIMQENYLIDPAVKGIVTLKTEKPLNKNTVFYMLENVLDLHGARIVKRKGHYRIFPKNKPAVSVLGFGDYEGKAKLGYGYRIIPLDYIPSAEMVKILESVTDKESIIRADDKRNLIILGGTSENVRNMLDAVEMFDVDWMKSSHVGLINIHYSRVNDIIDDLNKMLSVNNTEADTLNLITLDSIERLNSVLVITRQHKYLQRVKEWIRKLDIPAQGVESTLHVYQVKNSTAKELAATLGELFDSGQQGTATADNDVTGPGSKPVVLSEWGKKPEKDQPVITTDSTPAPKAESNINIISADDTNTLLISSTAAQYEQIKQALDKLDIQPLQVLIEVSIMDVQLTDAFSYGMQWFFEHGNATSGGSAVISDILNFPQTFSYSGVRDGGDINVVLGLLASEGKVDVLSSPSLLVRNNHKASIRVGDQQPIPTAAVHENGTIIATSVEYRDTGIILEIKPSITSSGTINVSITQEVIDVGDIDTATGQRTFLNRNLNTSVSVNNGETIILGGLIRKNSAVTKSGVPWLRDLPGIGFLFGKTVTSDVRTELLIMLSPKIIRNNDENNKVIEEYKEKFKFLNIDQLS